MSETQSAAPMSAPEVNSSIESSETQEVSSQEAPATELGHTSEAEIEADKDLSKAEKVEAKKALKELKIKFNGKEIVEQLPFEIPDDEAAKAYMTKQLQMSKLAQSKSQEHADLRKQVEDFIEFAKKDPRGLLSELGMDPRKFAEEVINEAIEESKKSPEQLEQEKLQKELAALKKERDEAKEAKEKAELSRLQEQEAQRLDSEMTEALKESGLPKSPYVIKRMADYMLLAVQNKIDLGAKDVIPLIKKEMQTDLKDFFSSSPDELVEELLTSDRIANIRKKQLSKARESQQVQNINNIKSTGADVKTPESGGDKSAKKITVRDWLLNS